MHLNVAFAYGAHVSANRQRNPRYRGFVGTVPVEIAEATSAQAPVVLRVHPAKGDPVDILMHGDRLYQAHAGRRGEPIASLAHEAAEGWRVERFRSLFASGWTRNYGPGSERYDEDAITGPIHDDPAVAKIHKSEFDARHAEVLAAVAPLLLVDGVLHREVAEPIQVMRDGYVSIGRYDDRHYADSVNFRADEACETDTPRKGGGTRAPDPRIEILDPGAVRAPLPHLALLSEVASLLDDMSRHETLKEATPTYFRAYADLRDAHARAVGAIPADRDATDMSQVLDALGPAREAHDAVQRERVDYAYLSGRLEDRFEKAIERLASFEAISSLSLPSR